MNKFKKFKEILGDEMTESVFNIKDDSIKLNAISELCFLLSIENIDEKENTKCENINATISYQMLLRFRYFVERNGKLRGYENRNLLLVFCGIIGCLGYAGVPIISGWKVEIAILTMALFPHLCSKVTHAKFP